MVTAETLRKNSDVNKERLSSHKIAVLWPGQVSFPGIGEGLCNSSSNARNLYSYTAGVLSVDPNSLHLRSLENPDTQAVQFSNAPYNMALWNELQTEHPELKVQVVGGHSFGEVCSFVAAGAINYSNFLDFLATRTDLMRKVNEKTPGALMVLAARRSKSTEEKEEKQKAFSELSHELQRKFEVEIAIYASKSKQTIGGRVEAIAEALEYAKRFGGHVLAQVLSKNGAPHTSLCEPIVNELRDAIRKDRISSPTIPVVTCSKPNPEIITTAQGVEEEIVAQATQPVYGDRLQEFLLQNGLTIIQLGEKSIIADNVVDDFGDNVEMEKVESHTKRNVAIGVGGALAVGAALTLGWKVTHKEKN